MDDAEQLMPLYLRFVRGVVDSNDLPLNVSREILQQSKDIEAIRAGCAQARCSACSKDLADSEDAATGKVRHILEEFGRVLKEGVGEDHANKERIAKPAALRFDPRRHATSRSSRWPTTSARMKEGQEKIYYVTADTFTAAKNSPHLEIFRKKGIEVLLLSDRVDEWVVGHLTEFDGKPLQSVAKGDLDLGKLEDEAEKKEAEKAADEYKELLEKIKAALGDQVKDVRVTLPPDRFAVLPGGRRARSVRQPGAHAQGGRPEGAGHQADPRNQPAASGGAAPQDRGSPLRRLGQRCCSTRRCSPKAASSTTRPASSSASTS